MNIIIADDEPLALEMTCEAVREVCPEANIYPFSKPSRLLEFAKETRCKIAFLDICMRGLCGSAIGSLAGVVASARLTAYRIEQLEKKVDKHNTVIERTYKLEETQAVMEEQIKVANHRIADLENQKEDSICR